MEGKDESFSLGGMNRWLTETQIDLIIVNAPKFFVCRLLYAAESSMCPESLKQKILGDCTTLTVHQQNYLEDIIFEFFYAGTTKTKYDRAVEIEGEVESDDDEPEESELDMNILINLPYSKEKRKLLEKLTKIADDFI